MSRRNEYLPLRRMLDYAREAVDLAQGKSRADLDRNRLLELALARLLEIIVDRSAMRELPNFREAVPGQTY